MAKPKKRLERSEKYRDGTKNDRDGRKKGRRIQVLYRSLENEIVLMSRAIREHWSIESMHWHLDVTFRQDANKRIDKAAAQNRNIIRKWCLSILKIIELSLKNKKLSLKKKRFAIGLAPALLLEEVLTP